MIPTILIVDDEKQVESLFKIHFRKETGSDLLKILFANDAKLALEMLAVDKHKIYVILSDINMPEMNGIEFLKIVKDKYPNIHIYMVSAYGDAVTIETTEKHGASGFFPKPVDFRRLKIEMIRLLELEKESDG